MKDQKIFFFNVNTLIVRIKNINTWKEYSFRVLLIDRFNGLNLFGLEVTFAIVMENQNTFVPTKDE